MPSAQLFLLYRVYFLAAGFFVVVFFFGAGVAVFFFSLSRPPIRLIASAALNGNCRTESRSGQPSSE